MCWKRGIVLPIYHSVPCHGQQKVREVVRITFFLCLFSPASDLIHLIAQIFVVVCVTDLSRKSSTMCFKKIVSVRFYRLYGGICIPRSSPESNAIQLELKFTNKICARRHHTIHRRNSENEQTRTFRAKWLQTVWRMN